MVRRFPLSLIALLAVLVPARAADPVVSEIWEIATLVPLAAAPAKVSGARVGYQHTRTVRDKAGRLTTTTALDLTFRRYTSAVRLRMEQGTVEADGQVVGVSMRQLHPGGRTLVLTGRREGDFMQVTIDAGRLERRVRWPAGVLGLDAQSRLPAERKVKVGDTFRFLRYDPIFNSVVTVKGTVGDRQMVPVGAGRRALLRLELDPEPLIAPGQKVQPPRAVWWLDDDLVPIRRQQDLEGLGTLILTRATKAEALALIKGPASVPGPLPRGAGAAPDVGLSSLVPLARPIPRAHTARSVLYRVTVKGDRDAASAFVSDTHQQVRRLGGETFELLVRPQRVGEAGQLSPRPGPECLGTSRYIDHADPMVRNLAAQAVGCDGTIPPSADLLVRAQRIERWVRMRLKPDNTRDLEPASAIARTLRGDCRSAAILTAALCRAQGIPARTAQGLLYVERGRRPALGFHMWTEVWIGGRWLGLDGILGLGRVTAVHVKISDHDWHGVHSLTPLLPVARVLGKLAVEAVRVE